MSRVDRIIRAHYLARCFSRVGLPELSDLMRRCADVWEAAP